MQMQPMNAACPCCNSSPCACIICSISTPPESIRLTQREREILLRVAEGHENGSISRLLTIAESSVEWHLKNIYAKLEVRNRTAAVVKAIQTGLLQV